MTFNDVNIDYIYEILCDVNKNMDNGLTKPEYADNRKNVIMEQLFIDSYIVDLEDEPEKLTLSTRGMLLKYKLGTLLACMTNHKDDTHAEELIFKL